MCQYLGSSYRLGTVISALTPLGEEHGKRSFSEARRIGIAIAESADAYKSAFLNIINSFLESSNIGFESVNSTETEPVHGRFDPGLIIDFQELKLRNENEGLEIAFRTCLTVCSGEAMSKVWTRSTLSSDNTPITGCQIETFSNVSKDLCSKINKACIELYEENFSVGDDVKVKLQEFGNIHLMGVDCAGTALSHSLERTFDDLSVSSATEKRIVDPEIAPALGFVASLDPTPLAKPDRVEGHQALSLASDARFFTYRSKSGALSVFVSHATESDAYLFGVVGCAEQNAATSEMAGSLASKRTTAEVATLIGRNY